MDAPIRPMGSKGQSSRPRMLMCYICGREFGSTSLPIHQPQCYEKWQNAQLDLPPHLRKTLKPPDEMNALRASASGTGMSARQKEQFNEQQFQGYSDNLTPCNNCGRRFAPDRLIVHQRSCRPGASGGGSKPVAGRAAPPPSYDEEETPPSRSGKAPPSRPAPKASPARRLPTGGSGDLDDLPIRSSGANSTMPSEYADDQDGRVPCPVCGRKFALDRIEKHETACRKASKKRAQFNSVSARNEGTENAAFVRQALRRPDPPKPPAAIPKWKQQSRALQQAMREQRKMSAVVARGGNLADLPPPPKSENPDYITCPYCQRRFNQTAGERHIPHCKNTVAKPKPPPVANVRKATAPSLAPAPAPATRATPTAARPSASAAPSFTAGRAPPPAPVLHPRSVSSASSSAPKQSGARAAASASASAPTSMIPPPGSMIPTLGKSRGAARPTPPASPAAARTTVRPSSATRPSPAGRSAPSPSIRFCGDCGSEFNNSAKFCGECGAPRA